MVKMFWVNLKKTKIQTQFNIYSRSFVISNMNFFKDFRNLNL